MEIKDREAIELELKYCERCGALWLRLRGAQDIYCAPCVTGNFGLRPRHASCRASRAFPGTTKSTARRGRQIEQDFTRQGHSMTAIPCLLNQAPLPQNFDRALRRQDPSLGNVPRHPVVLGPHSGFC